MRFKIALLLTLLCISSICPRCGAEDYKNTEDANTPPEMETLKQGTVNVMVPKGVQFRKQSTVTLIEDTDMYAARKFSETDGRFKNIEKEIEAQKNDIRDMKKIIENMNQAIDKMTQEKNVQK